MTDKLSLREKFKRLLFSNFTTLGCLVSNSTKSIQYLGMSLNSGRIMVFDCSLNSSKAAVLGNPSALSMLRFQDHLDKNKKLSGVEKLLIEASLASLTAASCPLASTLFRSDIIMGHTSNVELIQTKNFDGSYNLKDYTFLQIIVLNDSQLGPKTINEIANDKNPQIKRQDIHQRINPLLVRSSVSGPSNSLDEIEQKQHDLVFIQSYDNILEKNIGHREQKMVVLKSTILGFHNTIKFNVNPKNSLFVEVSGQGLLYLDTQSQAVTNNEIHQDPDIIQALETFANQ